MKKRCRILSVLLFTVVLILACVMPLRGIQTVSAAGKVDQKVLEAQKWLNRTYSGKYCYKTIPEDGHTGNKVVTALTQALQIELGFGNSSTGNFGNGTMSRCPTISMSNPGNNKNIIIILQHALFCKGYGEYDDYGTFGPQTSAAVRRVQSDAGLDATGTVTPMLFKAILNTDGLVLNRTQGDPTVRTIQQALNRKYNSYFGIKPCDGVYGRSTNQALIYALQAEEGMDTQTANGNFGNGTISRCPSLTYGDTRSNYVTLLQYALYCNGYNPGAFDGVYSAEVKRQVAKFQRFMCLNETGDADRGTLMSLFTTCGDTTRSAQACDTSTRLDSAKVKTLKDAGYSYVGRYLTNSKSGKLDKKMTTEEVKTILDGGLKIFPIYQTYGGEAAYYTAEQGNEDAVSAVTAAVNLGIPSGSTIYFAVDYDAYDYQVTENIIPYFEQVSSRVKALNEGYSVGIYAPRNVCNRVYQKGYAKYCFVSDASKGYSGNLGYLMPAAWTFDQYKTDITIGSGSGKVSIDKVAYSGRDAAVSCMDDTRITEELSNQPSQPQTNSYWADPVNLATGAHDIEHELISVNGAQNVGITLSYSSAGTGKGIFGRGFSWNYESRTEEKDGKLRVYRTPSSYTEYEKQEDGTYISAVQGRSREKITATEEGGYLLDTGSSQYIYDSNGRLIREKNAEGLEVIITYADGITQIEDGSSGQKITLTHNSEGLVTLAEDGCGNRAVLTYGSDGTLTGITTPDGYTTHYTYDEYARITSGTDGEEVCYFKDSYDSLGRIIKQEDAQSGVTYFEYDDSACDGTTTVTVTDREGGVKSYVYSPLKQLLSETDQNGNTVRYTYDSEGRLAAVTDAAGNSVIKEYTEDGLLKTQTASDGAETKYEYDDSDNVTCITYPDGGTVRYTYDEYGRRKTVTDQRGTVTEYVYNEKGYLAETVTGDRVTEYTYENGQVKTVKDPEGAVITTTYDAAGSVTGTTDPLGNTVAQTVTPSQRVKSMTDALGYTSYYEYNSRGEITKETDPEGNSITYTYDGNGNLKTKKDRNGAVTAYEYDREDRLVKTTYPDGSKSSITYDPAGRVIRMQDSEGGITEYEYDSTGSITCEKGPEGKTVRYTYDSTGRKKSVTDSDGHTTSYSYDKAGRMISQTDPDGGVTEYTYSTAGDLLAQTDALGRTTQYTYDAYGNCTSVTDAQSHTSYTEYDLCGRITKSTDATGRTVTYSYDACGHISSIVNADGGITTYGYDKNGRQITVTDPEGATETTEYDSRGNIISVTDASGIKTEQYTYDAAGNVITQTDALGSTTEYARDAAGRITSQTDVLGRTAEYSYDAEGRQTSVTDAMGNRADVTYDGAGRLKTLTGPAGSLLEYTYDADGKELSETTVTGEAKTYTYNAKDLVKSVTNGRKQTTSYEYDAAGEVTEADTPEGKVTYSYDSSQRVTETVSPDGTVTSKTYDAAGNITQSSSDTGTVTMEYSTGNCITLYNGTETVTDADGNLVQAYTESGKKEYVYDSRNRLVKTSSSQYTYDDENYRIKSGTEEYCYD
ncbi:MAG: DUF1906 domain-containing protein, partial [Lachnospiraceae bacterium]|nr:DUF1906 domain-containing protein [Lachnospiraceae bacterium]